MPLDIQMFRDYQGGDPEAIRESQRRRFASVEIVDEIIEKDASWRTYTGDIDNLKKARNAKQKEVAEKKKAKLPCDEMLAEIKSFDQQVLDAEAAQEAVKIEVNKLLSKVGNICDLTVPVSQDEDKDNRIERKWGTPRDPAGLLNHHDLLWRIGGYEPERGTAVAGHRGYFLKDVGVLLNQAFINYGIAFLRKRGYTVLQPPYFMKKEMMAGVAQLEQFDEELYKVGGDGDDKYLIATSEQPICGYHAGEWMDEKTLPLRYSGISTCFRKEAGSHGKDTWGIFRVHQFEKVEQFIICEGDLEKSQKIQNEMIATAEEFYQSLGFPYHVINIVTGALNNAAIKKLDLECWFPGYNAYRELVSCSNCTDYQSRAMEIRSGIKKAGDREKKYVHMLNATLCATGRAICCLLETYQDKTGVHIPEVLVTFMGGLTYLPFVRDSKITTAPGAAPKPAAAAAAPKPAAAAAAPKPAAAAAAPKPAAAAAAPTPTAAPAGARGNLDSVLTSEINAKGEEIRALKAAKGDKDAVKALVDQLLALKVSYKDKIGKDFGGVPVKDAPKKEETPPAAPAAPKAAAAAAPPAAPKEVPKYTTPAPVSSAAAVSLPSLDALLKGGVVDLVALDRTLSTYSYVGGYLPSKKDAHVLAAVRAAGTSTEGLTNVSRWLRNIVSFSDAEMTAWN